MKVFLMYYDRYQSATTSLMLNREHIVLCHSNKEMFTCISNKATVIETGLPKGIQNNFNYGLGLLEDGEWGVFMSDDLVCGRELTGKNFTRVDHNYVLDVFINKVNKIQNNRINLIGMNATGNELNSTREVSTFGLVDGRCFAIRKTEFTFHPHIQTIPDYYATAYHLEKYGANLVFNHFFLDFKRYHSGGLGTSDDRLEQKKKDIRTLISLFPDTVKMMDKKSQPKGSHVVIKYKRARK